MNKVDVVFVVAQRRRSQRQKAASLHPSLRVPATQATFAMEVAFVLVPV